MALRKSGRLSLVSWRGAVKDEPRTDKGNDLGAAKCYVTMVHGRSGMKSRIIMPTRTNRILRAVSWAEGEKEIPLERRNKHRQICLPPLLAGAPVQEKSWSSEKRINESNTILLLAKKNGRFLFFCRDTLPSHYADIRSELYAIAYIR